ncbi:MAG: metalloendopeptidase, partial [Brevibacillus sp.]|nr:metalloendopeptidase [Brevibacillus sp.]
MNRCLHKSSSRLWTKVLGVFFICLGLGVTGTSGSGVVAAVEPGPVISLVIDGKGIPTEVQPLRQNGRMLVPIRVIAESTGAEVTYDASNRQVTVTEKGKRIVLLVDSQTAYVDGKRVTLDAPAMIVSRRTVVPIRFVSEALGYQVVWESGVAQIQTKPIDDTAAVIKEAS